MGCDDTCVVGWRCRVAEEVAASVGATALIVELVVIGTGGLVAGAVTFDAVAGTDLIGAAKDASSALTTALVALAYALGVVLDRVADAVGEPLGRRWRRPWFDGPAGEAAYQHALARVLARPELERRLVYGRSRLRVCRGGALDGLLLVAATAVRAVAGPAAVDCRVLVSECAFGAVFVGACVFAWRQLARAQYRQVASQGAS